MTSAVYRLAAQQTTPQAVPDTLDSMSLAEKLRTDSTLHRTAEDLTRPIETLNAFVYDLTSELIDPNLWIGLVGLIAQDDDYLRPGLFCHPSHR